MLELSNPFPLETTSLIHCITNEISCEMLANGILALGCKPVMADDPREVLDFTSKARHSSSIWGICQLRRKKQSVWQLLMQIKLVSQW